VFERKHEKLTSLSVFAKRMATFLVMAGILITVALSLAGQTEGWQT
jgi:hypothetical protein